MRRHPASCRGFRAPHWQRKTLSSVEQPDSTDRAFAEVVVLEAERRLD